MDFIQGQGPTCALLEVSLAVTAWAESEEEGRRKGREGGGREKAPLGTTELGIPCLESFTLYKACADH